MSPYDLMTAEGANLAAWTKGRRFGSVVVVDARASVGENSFGHTSVFIDLTLANPAEGELTWPTDDLFALHRAVDEQALRVLSDRMWHVRLHAEHPPPLAEEDDLPSEQPW